MTRFYRFCAVALALTVVPCVQAQQRPPQGPVNTTAVPAPPATDAEKTIDAARDKVAKLKSVAADIVQAVEMLGQKFQVKGRYLRDTKSKRVYLKLTVDGLPGAVGTMLQVCDGVNLWDYQQILDAQMFRRIRIGPVYEKLAAPEITADFRKQVDVTLGFSGPEALLAGLRTSVRFDRQEPGELDGKKVWIIRGEWRNRDGLVGANQQPLPATALLPSYVPSMVTLWVGQEDGWPYQVELKGRRPSQLYEDVRRRGPDNRPEGAARLQQIQVTNITLTYRNVIFNPVLKLEEFAFRPPAEARVQDDTDALVGRLDQQIQMELTRKKQEAAKTGLPGESMPGDGDALKEKLTLPPSPADVLPKGR